MFETRILPTATSSAWLNYLRFESMSWLLLSPDRFHLASTGKSTKWLKAAVLVTVLIIIVFGAFVNSQLALDRMHTIGCPKCERYIKLFSAMPLTSYLLVFALGVVSGFAPCLAALIPIVVGLTSSMSRSSRRVILRTVLSIASGVFYAYLIIPNVMILIPGVIQSLEVIVIFLGVTLTVLGVAHLAEASYLSGLSSGSEGGMGPVFKTPAFAKKFAAEALAPDNMHIYFLIGVLFSVVELSCIGSLLFVSLPLSRPANFVASVVLFDAGLIIPVIVVALSACVGFLRIAQLRGLHSKAGIVQKLIMGVILIAAGLLLIF